MLKIGQNCGKIANYPPQCSTRIGTTDANQNTVDYSDRCLLIKYTKQNFRK